MIALHSDVSGNLLLVYMYKCNIPPKFQDKHENLLKKITYLFSMGKKWDYQNINRQFKNSSFEFIITPLAFPMSLGYDRGTVK